MLYRRGRPNLGRRLTGPIIILMVAAVIAVLMWQRQEAQSAQVKAFVERMCDRIALNDTVTWNASDPSVARPLTQRLYSMFEGDSYEILDWNVQIVAADLLEEGGDSATHTATILADDVPMLYIRLLYDEPAASTDPEIEVIGYWVQ
jgi:hypothetical protein